MYLQPKDYSPSPVDLIPPDETEDDEPQADQRCLKYALYGSLVDKDDVKAMIAARLMEHLELDHVSVHVVAARDACQPVGGSPTMPDHE
jgi:hypothetical protein